MKHLADRLLTHKVPEEYRVAFKHLTELTYFLRDYETDEPMIFGYLAWEYQNQRRRDIMLRLYRRLGRIRTNIVREEINDGRFD